jgi:putative transposase
LGLLLAAWITTADVQDRHAAAAVLPLAKLKFPTLQKVWADGGYEGPQVEDIAKEVGLKVEVIKRSGNTKGFVVQAKRWIVERTHGWLNRFRRLSKDYERREDTAIAFIRIGIIYIILRRLA